jgi:uncharacterized protein
MGESKVFLFDNSDPEMQQAYEKARETFRYFWRELAWERRRIIPGLTLASVKAPFSDGEDAEPVEGQPDVEHMWIDDVDFDGQFVTGVLLNSPNWLKTVAEGDPVSVPLAEISDWMYAIGTEVYGAHTVNLLRSRMGREERAEHDAAWGLEFGDPRSVRLAPGGKKGGFLKSLFGGAKEEVPEEHPMSENAGPAFAEQLAANPEMASDADDRGWTLLHHQALAGSTATVKALLEHGADPAAVTSEGHTPLDLAQALNWEKVVELLARSKPR